MSTKLFYILIISFIACKQQNVKNFNFGHSTSDRINFAKKNDEGENEKKVLIRRIVPAERNALVDSVYFFGVRNQEKDVVDSFIIFYNNKIEQRIIIKKDENGLAEYDFLLPDDNQNIFRNFNADSYPDLVFIPVSKAAAQLSWSVIYLFNPKLNSYELAKHLAMDGLEYLEKNKEYIQKMNGGLGRYSLKRYKLLQNNSQELIAYETFYVEHNFHVNKYQKNFLIEYENFDTKFKYKDTCLIKMTDCKIKYISCNKKIFIKLKQAWMDFYTFQKDLAQCPEMDL